MRHTNKIISLLLAAVIAVSAMPAALAADYAERSVITDIEFLAKLGVFKGYEDGQLHPEYSITRMEYAALVMRCIGMEMDGGGFETPFSDVPRDSWGSGYVKTAFDMGIINGYEDGRFRPEQNVTQEEAVKILLSALGKRRRAESLGGYPSGYNALASQLKIVSQAVKSDTPATRSYIAGILVNSLDVEISFEEPADYNLNNGEKKSLLKYMNLTVRRGVLTAVYGTNIADETECDEGEIIVSGEKYKVSDNVPLDYVGMSVNLYVRDFGEDSETVDAVLPIYDGKNYIEVKADDVSDKTTLGSFVYYKNNAETVQSLASDITICYNGSVITNSVDLSVDKLKPKTGFVRLLDTDSNGTYDVVFVKDYRTYVVKSIDSNGIYDIFGNKIEVNGTDVTKSVSMDDEILGWDDIRGGDVLSVAANTAGSVLDIIICRKKVSGNLELIRTKDGEPEYGLKDGAAYRMSYEYQKALKENYRDAVEPEVGKNYTFSLNDFGEISAISTTVITEDNETIAEKPSADALYGFLISFSCENAALSNYVNIRYLTGKNTIDTLHIEGDKKVRFGRMSGGTYDVSRISASSLADYFRAQSEVKRQMFKYALDSDGDVKEFYFEDTTGSADCFSKLGGTSSKTVAYNTIGYDYYFDENTAVFSLPALGMYEEQLSSGTPSDYFSNNSAYDVQLWDTDKGYVPCIVYTTQAATTKYYISEIEYYIDYVNSPVMIVTDVETVMSEDGTPWRIVEGWEEKKKVRRLLSDTLSGSSEAVRDIQPGAVIQYTTNKADLNFALYSEDDEAIQRYSLMCNLNNTSQDDFMLYDYSKKRIVTSRIAFGLSEVERFDYPYIRIKQNGCLYTIHDGTRAYKYNTKTQTLTQIDPMSISQGSRVFLRTRYSSLREIVVVE